MDRCNVDFQGGAKQTANNQSEQRHVTYTLSLSAQIKAERLHFIVHTHHDCFIQNQAL